MCGHGIDAFGASAVPYSSGRSYFAGEIFCLVPSRGMEVASSARQKFLRKRTESPHRSERGTSARSGHDVTDKRDPGTRTLDVPKTPGADEPFYPESFERCRRS